MWEELFVSTLEDVELRVVEFRIDIYVAVSSPDEAADSRATLRWELAVEDDDDVLVWAGWDDGGPEEEVLHLVLLVEIQSPLETTTQQTRSILLLQSPTFTQFLQDVLDPT